MAAIHSDEFKRDAVRIALTSDPANGGCAVGTPPVHLGMRLVADTPH